MYSRIFPPRAFHQTSNVINHCEMNALREVALNPDVDLNQIDMIASSGGRQSMNPLFDLVTECSVMAHKARSPRHYFTKDNQATESAVIDEIKTHLPKIKEAFDYLVASGANPDHRAAPHYPHSACEEARLAQQRIDHSNVGLTDVTKPLFDQAISLLKHMETARCDSRFKM